MKRILTASMLAATMAGSAGAASAPAEAIRTHRLRLDAAVLYSESGLHAQPAVLTVDFDMESAADVNNERRIANLRFTLDIKAVGNGSMPAYTMRTLDADSPVDFYPPDPMWWRRERSYSEESIREDAVRFHIEIPANIELRAASTVLDNAVKRLGGGRAYGSKALLTIHPYCTRDLKNCRLGTLTGITYRNWGLGWVEGLYPEFRLISDETFSLIPLSQGTGPMNPSKRAP